MKLNSILSKTSIIFLLLIVISSCSSNINELGKRDRIDLKMELTPSQAENVSENEVIKNLRIILTSKESNEIIKNQRYELSENGMHFQIVISDVPEGMYDAYIFANEDVLESDKNTNLHLDNISSKTELEQLSTPNNASQFSNRIPYAGKKQNVLIDKTHTNLKIALKRLISKLVININNLGTEELNLTKIKIGNVLDIKNLIFTKMYETNSPNPKVLSIEKAANYTVSPKNSIVVTQYLYEVVAPFPTLDSPSKALTLGLEGAGNQIYDPQMLKEKGGNLLDAITSNTVYRINISINNDKIVGIELDIHPWDKFEASLPTFK